MANRTSGWLPTGILFFGTVALVACLLFPYTEYPSKFQRETRDGVSVDNQLYLSRSLLPVWEAIEPPNRVVYETVAGPAVFIIIITAMLFVGSSFIGSRKKSAAVKPAIETVEEQMEKC